VRFLLDTHVVIWWLTANPNLDDAVRAQILAATEVHVSAASIWEIAIKQAAGRLEGPADLAENARDAGFLQLSMTAGHAIAAGALPPIHRDPFDRMLVAQARCAQLTLVTRDDSIAKYDVQLLKV
jgi:PIN domain nuclease of toxin-antitoxin system